MAPILRESKEAAKFFPYHPWTGIFTYMWLIFYGFHVGISTVRPMDCPPKKKKQFRKQSATDGT